MRRLKILLFASCVVLNRLLICWGNQKDMVPDWLQAGKTIKGSEVSKEDYLYLAGWLDVHAKSAQQYLIDLFARHQIVIVGEFHHIKEHKELVLDLIPRLYHEADVRSIGWEFSRHTDNKKLERLVTAPEFNKEAVLDFARDQLAHEWNSKEHWDFIEKVWQLNKSLEPGQEKMRLLGLGACPSNPFKKQLFIAL